MTDEKYIYKARNQNNSYFLIVTSIKIVFSLGDCNYLLSTRYFNSHTQAKAFLVAATRATLHRELQDYFLLGVKCWNFLYGVAQTKISVN